MGDENGVIEFFVGEGEPRGALIVEVGECTLFERCGG